MKPSAVERKRQKRREKRRQSRERKRQWKELHAHGTSTDEELLSTYKEDTLVQDVTQVSASTGKNHRVKQNEDINHQERKKQKQQPSTLKQFCPREDSKTMKSLQNTRKKAKGKSRLLSEMSSHTATVQSQHMKQKTTSKKRPLSKSQDQSAPAKKLKTKKSPEKHGHEITAGDGTTARLDCNDPKKLFKSITSPVSYENFFSEYWEKKPLIAKRNDPAVSEVYKELFSRDVLRRLLKKHQIEYVSDVNVCRYVSGKRESLNGTGRATCKQIDKLFDQSKATVQFHQPQRFQDQLWRVCGMLECLFGCLVGANVYMTPPGSQGLAPHYDDVEVFILQLEGRKHWRLYTPPVDLPRDYSRDLDQDSIGQPTHDFVLEAGDMLYFPRGTVHQADTPVGTQHSTHVTISTYQRNSYGDLMTSTLPMLVQTAMDNNVEFRKGLPVGALSTVGVPFQQDSLDMRSHLKKLLVSLAEEVESSSATLLAPDLLQDFMSNRLPPYSKDSEPLASPKGMPPTLDSYVKMRFPGYMALCLHPAETQDESEDEDDADEDSEDEDEDNEDNVDEEDEDEEDEKEEEEEQEKDEETEINKSTSDGPEWVYVYHCLHNRREDHMMGSGNAQPQGLKFPAQFLPALQRLMRMTKDDRVQVKELGLEAGDNIQVATNLWAEGLIEMC